MMWLENRQTDRHPHSDHKVIFASRLKNCSYTGEKAGWQSSLSVIETARSFAAIRLQDVAPAAVDSRVLTSLH